MIPVHCHPDPVAARELLEHIRFLLLRMKDFIGNILEGDGSPSVTTAEEFYRRWGYMVTLKDQLEVELEKAEEYRDAVPVRTPF